MTILAAIAIFMGMQDVQTIEVPQLPNLKPEAYTVWSELGGNPIEITVTYELSPRKLVHIYNYCENECLGKKHMDHKKCDFSCDDSDRNGPRHTLETHAYYYRTYGKDTESLNESAFLQAMQQFGVPNAGEPMAEAINGVGQSVLPGIEVFKEFKVDHWNQTPCSSSKKNVEYQSYAVLRTVQLLRIEGNVVVKGPKLTHEIGEYQFPTGRILTYKPEVQCRCSVVALDGDGNPVKEVLPEHGAVPIKGDPNVGVACSTTELEQNGMAFVCQDMNKGVFQCTSSPASNQNFFLPAGTLLQPEKDAVQWMMTIGDAVYNGDGSISGSFLSLAEQVRISCTEINKKEPDPKVKFRIRQNPDTQLVKIAQACAKERSKGPWTQGRVWIATDAAKYAEIEKVMLPAPGKRIYVEGMFQCATIGEYDFVHGKHKRCLEPAQIGWGAVTQEANLWLINTLARADIEALAAFVSKTPSGHDALFSNARSQSDCAPAAALANALLGSSSKKAREAGFTFLMKGVPDSKRAEFIASGGVGRVAMMLCGTDKASAEEAMKVAEAYQGKGFEFALRNVNASLPESLKKKAAELLKKGG